MLGYVAKSEEGQLREVTACWDMWPSHWRGRLGGDCMLGDVAKSGEEQVRGVTACWEM